MCRVKDNSNAIPARQHLREKMSLRCICSQAILADSLAKCMSGDVLREALGTGAYRRFDEDLTLQTDLPKGTEEENG